jgi:hypothetical protein
MGEGHGGKWGKTSMFSVISNAWRRDLPPPPGKAGRKGDKARPGKPPSSRKEPDAGRRKSFPAIGNIFSIHWKIAENFFHSLEKPARFFQPLEKNFPLAGKLRSQRAARPGRPETALAFPAGRG